MNNVLKLLFSIEMDMCGKLMIRGRRSMEFWRRLGNRLNKVVVNIKMNMLERRFKFKFSLLKVSLNIFKVINDGLRLM
ncbi:hypothetical protein, partial [Staphylococcus epidermidis]|uniref:hypothetical protein n=1 Tax=Staphylococcus epidermidis TaxID=1282 RepID=UPI001C930747